MPVTTAVEDPSVTGARAGDPLAWTDLYQHYEPVIERYLEIVDPALAADTDTVWERAAKALADQPAGIVPLIWLMRSAWECRSDESPAPSHDPALRAVQHLPATERDVIALRVVAGLDEREVGAVMGKADSRVRAIGHSGLRRLLRLADAVQDDSPISIEIAIGDPA